MLEFLTCGWWARTVNHILLIQLLPKSTILTILSYYYCSILKSENINSCAKSAKLLCIWMRDQPLQFYLTKFFREITKTKNAIFIMLSWCKTVTGSNLEIISGDNRCNTVIITTSHNVRDSVTKNPGTRQRLIDHPLRELVESW